MNKETGRSRQLHITHIELPRILKLDRETIGSGFLFLIEERQEALPQPGQRTPQEELMGKFYDALDFSLGRLIRAYDSKQFETGLNTMLLRMQFIGLEDNDLTTKGITVAANRLADKDLFEIKKVEFELRQFEKDPQLPPLTAEERMKRNVIIAKLADEMLSILNITTRENMIVLLCLDWLMEENISPSLENYQIVRTEVEGLIRLHAKLKESEKS